MRSQFTFYSSFQEAAKRIKSKTARCDFYDAIIQYALNGDEPDMDELPDAAAIGFVMAKPTLDASKRKAESGKAGGSRKQTGSKTEANGKQEEIASKEEKEKEKEKEKENECSNTGTRAIAYFLDNVNASPSPLCLEELRAYAADLSDAVCIHALQVALDEHKTNWSYIRAILQRYSRDGLRDIADVLAAEKAHAERKEAAKDGLSGNAAGSAETKRFNIHIDNADE